MNLSINDLTDLSEVALKAATIAGKMISRTRPLDVQHKADGGDCAASQVLTEVDLASQELILGILEPTFTEFDLALLAEESPDDGSRLVKDYFWCIDPIDGTLPFVEGVPGYAVAISLISKAGIPQIGVVYDPVEHHLYHAIIGQGAFKNGEPWTVTPNREQTAPLHLITDRSFAEQPEFPEVLNGLESFGYPSVETITHGGGVMNAIWVLEQVPACYFKFPKPGKGGGCFWDYAATACIYHELGGIATDIHGAPLELNRAESIYMNHKGNLFTTDTNLAEQITRLYNQLNEGERE